MREELIQSDLKPCSYCGERYWDYSPNADDLVFCCNCGLQIPLEDLE